MTGTYNNLNQISTFNAQTYTYDANGNLSADGTRTYTFDAADRLKTITQGATTVTFAYDGLGRRLKQTVGATETRYLWCGTAICQQRDGADAYQKRFYSEGEYVHTGTKKYLTLTDHLGSVRDVIDITGTPTLVGSFDYRPYGEVARSWGTVTTGYTYAGLFAQTNTSLLLSTTRAYNPANGKWLNVDPIREAGGINLTGYVGASPIFWIDPLGLEAKENLFPPHQTIHGNFDNVPVIPGYFIVGIHASPDSGDLSPKDLATKIKANKDYKAGMTVVLMACESGKRPDGYANAHAKALNAAVIAPDKLYIVYTNGSYETSDVVKASWIGYIQEAAGRPFDVLPDRTKPPGLWKPFPAPGKPADSVVIPPQLLPRKSDPGK